ncbi:Major Facilitator Superfamily transporter [uncultured Sphingopyxis sp.]|uniref:Major Facilitator Superfamily transporter n=2 Tax=uncultured Sphingopyxis sp. TaxID=310581 RepID=A0A1Y5Q2J5_9SPHN|nr:Major Facilitator Superfamily transporter [uncultured Sphingopyxis sp.]
MQDLHVDNPRKRQGNGVSRGARRANLHIWNMCFALFGIQIVWALQNANTTRIFQTLGADVAALPALWIAGPITGLVVQPIVGHLSDRSRSRFGRRRPFLIAGGLLTALALLIMPNAATLWASVAALWLLTASNNISMDPARALVADNLPEAQRARGYAIQVFFIGAGAVFASSLPWMLVNWFGVSGAAEPGALPAAVRYAFYIGSACLLLSVFWTAALTHEQPARVAMVSHGDRFDSPADRASGRLLALAGAGLLLAAVLFRWRWEVLVLGASALMIGAGQLAAAWRRGRGADALGLLQIGEDYARMPVALKRLALVQFFTWFALFTLWIYAAPTVASRYFGSNDPASAAYSAAADWVGVLFAAYNGVAAIGALALPALAARIGERATYALCLLCGAAGMAGFVFASGPAWLWIAAVGIGIAWAAILSLPYAIIVNAVPAGKVGVYLGIHNIFLVVPQLVAAICLGGAVQHLFGGQPAPALALAALFLGAAALAALAIPASRS